MNRKLLSGSFTVNAETLSLFMYIISYKQIHFYTLKFTMNIFSYATGSCETYCTVRDLTKPPSDDIISKVSDGASMHPARWFSTELPGWT